MNDTLTATEKEQDAALSRVMEKHAAFKHPNLTRMACAIIRAAMQSGGGCWPDDESLILAARQLSGADKNVIGTAYRWLGNLKIMERMNLHRKSLSKSSKGREVAQWRLRSWRLAETFLSRNEPRHRVGQQEFFES
jgi:hypothetical protein